MLQLLSSKELVLLPKNDETLSGNIIIVNNAKGCFIPYKIKSTNPNLFYVEPNRGVLSYKQTEKITITTIDAINSIMAKQLSQKHKFLVEYVILDHMPRANQQGIAKIFGPTVQSFRVYINTDSVRNSRQLSPHEQSERGSVLSKGYSFHSAHNKFTSNRPMNNNINSHNNNGRDNFFRNNPINNLVSSNITPIQPHSQNLEQLNSQIQYLEQQRSNLMLGSGKKKIKSSGILVKVVFAIIGVIAGNFGAKYVGFPQHVRSAFNEAQQKVQEESGGFFAAEEVAEQPPSKGGWWWS